MISIPNILNTNAVCEGIADGFWANPFRSLYPNRRDFTYSPFNRNAPNRSRIDIFRTSHNLLRYVEDMTHEPLLTKLFDHKAVVLNINVKTDIHLNRTITELTQVINEFKNTAIYKVKLLKRML